MGQSTTLNQLIQSLLDADQALQTTRFVAPCVFRGKIQTRIQGLVRTFSPVPKTFEGWGIFQPKDLHTADLIEEASLDVIARYCALLKSLRVRLIVNLDRKTWLAYPVNGAEMQARFGLARPMMVHLVTEGSRFDVITVRGNGQVWWYEDQDRRADPLPAESMREAFEKLISSEQLKFSGMTPEMRQTYHIARSGVSPIRSDATRRAVQRPAITDDQRLRRALELGGGKLVKYTDRDEFWLVEWQTPSGEAHTSAINKHDLTVVSSGICLSGRDRDFDLQSLVNVIEQRFED